MSTASLTGTVSTAVQLHRRGGTRRGFCRASERGSDTLGGLFTIYPCSPSHSSLRRGCCFTQEDAGSEPSSSEQLPGPFSDPEVLSHLRFTSPTGISSLPCQRTPEQPTRLRTKQLGAFISF